MLAVSQALDAGIDIELIAEVYERAWDHAETGTPPPGLPLAPPIESHETGRDISHQQLVRVLKTAHTHARNLVLTSYPDVHLQSLYNAELLELTQLLAAVEEEV